MKAYIPKVGERVEAASRFVAKCNKLLDVGCGDGVIQYFINDHVNHIFGIDGSSERLAKASRRGLTVEIVDLDTEDIPFKANYFDAATCLDVIEHVRDPKDLLVKIHKVLKKDGKLIITTPNIRFTNHIYDLVIQGKFPKTSLDKTPYDGGHLHFFTYADLVSLVKATGFLLIKKEGVINKPRRGWKGRILEFIFGKDLMLEFRAPGILLVCQKI